VTRLWEAKGPEPGYQRIQREHGETPPRSDTEALANIVRYLDPFVRIRKEGR
jgi:hypothetical protein